MREDQVGWGLGIEELLEFEPFCMEKSHPRSTV